MRRLIRAPKDTYQLVHGNTDHLLGDDDGAGDGLASHASNVELGSTRWKLRNRRLTRKSSRFCLHMRQPRRPEGAFNSVRATYRHGGPRHRPCSLSAPDARQSTMLRGTAWPLAAASRRIDGAGKGGRPALRSGHRTYRRHLGRRRRVGRCVGTGRRRAVGGGGGGGG